MTRKRWWKSIPRVRRGVFEIRFQHEHAVAAEPLLQFAQRAFRQQPPVINDADALAKRLGFFEVMRRVENRRARRAQAADEFQNVQPRLRINAHGRLVEQQQLRPMQQRAAEIDAPLHAAGVSLHRVLRAVGQRERFEQFGRARLWRRRNSSPPCGPRIRDSRARSVPRKSPVPAARRP